MQKKHPPLKHFWFDFAGTLYKETFDFKQAHKAVRYTTYAKLIKKAVDDDIKREYQELYKKYGSNSAVFKALGKPDDFWQKAVDSFNRQAFLLPDPVVPQTLDLLRKKVPVSIFTNFMLSKIEELLDYLEIPQDYFTYILSGDDVPQRKPALDGFKLMIETAKLPPENMIYIGDRVAVDILPAKAVGMQACLLYGESETADYCFDSFSNLLQLVK